jgi:3-oxoacyl-[acyl-carrier protein] reductase
MVNTVCPDAAGPRTVLITGASGGVGAGVARSCGEVGWEVWIAARREREGRAVADAVTAAGGLGRFVACDVGDESDVARAVALVLTDSGRLDGVVHNATSGYSPVPHHPAHIPVIELADHMRVALRALYLLVRYSHDPLRDASGSLVVMTSEAGFEGKRLLAAYAGVKAAQRALVRVLAREWGPEGIRVNGVAPLAATPAMIQAFANDPTMEERVLGRIPLGRLGDPAPDVGPVVRFLLGAEARFVTGQTIMADGGSCPIT